MYQPAGQVLLQWPVSKMILNTPERKQIVRISCHCEGDCRKKAFSKNKSCLPIHNAIHRGYSDSYYDKDLSIIQQVIHFHHNYFVITTGLSGAVSFPFNITANAWDLMRWYWFTCQQCIQGIPQVFPGYRDIIFWS